MCSCLLVKLSKYLKGFEETIELELKAKNYPLELVDYRPQELNQNGINFGPAASYFIKEMKKKSF